MWFSHETQNIDVVAPALLTVYFGSGRFESAVKQLGGRLKSQIILKIHLIGENHSSNTPLPRFPLFRAQATPAVLHSRFNYKSQQLLIIKNPQSINTPASWSAAEDSVTSGAASHPGGKFGAERISLAREKVVLTTANGLARSLSW